MFSYPDLGIGLAGIEIYLPEERFETAQLVERGKLTADQLRRIGVSSVPVAAPDQHPSDLMIEAGRRLLERLEIPASGVDLVITASVVPPEYQMRTLAGRVSHGLGTTRATGFDLYQGCNAFVTQLDLAYCLLASRPTWNNVLLVAGDRWAEYTDQRVATNMLFGDAGAAALVTRGNTWLRPVAASSLLDGYLYDMAGTPFGSRAFADHGGRPEDLSYAVFDQQKLVSAFVPTNLPSYLRVAKETLDTAGLNLEQIAGLHVPAGRDDLMRKLVTSLEFSLERTNHPYLAEHGDLSSVGPYADIARLSEEPFVAEGDYLLSLTQGGAMVWSGLILRRS
jgi:3-oxoacyl-[acyl-carrier-protein] synthase III